jgi:hypothetical protein
MKQRARPELLRQTLTRYWKYDMFLLLQQRVGFNFVKLQNIQHLFEIFLTCFRPAHFKIRNIFIKRLWKKTTFRLDGISNYKYINNRSIFLNKALIFFCNISSRTEMFPSTPQSFSVKNLQFRNDKKINLFVFSNFLQRKQPFSYKIIQLLEETLLLKKIQVLSIDQLLKKYKKNLKFFLYNLKQNAISGKNGIKISSIMQKSKIGLKILNKKKQNIFIKQIKNFETTKLTNNAINNQIDKNETMIVNENVAKIENSPYFSASQILFFLTTEQKKITFKKSINTIANEKLQKKKDSFALTILSTKILDQRSSKQIKKLKRSWKILKLEKSFVLKQKQKSFFLIISQLKHKISVVTTQKILNAKLSKQTELQKNKFVLFWKKIKNFIRNINKKKLIISKINKKIYKKKLNKNLFLIKNNDNLETTAFWYIQFLNKFLVYKFLLFIKNSIFNFSKTFNVFFQQEFSFPRAFYLLQIINKKIRIMTNFLQNNKKFYNNFINILPVVQTFTNTSILAKQLAIELARTKKHWRVIRGMELIFLQAFIQMRKEPVEGKGGFLGFNVVINGRPNKISRTQKVVFSVGNINKSNFTRFNVFQTNSASKAQIGSFGIHINAATQ